ncbi:amidase signature domain-containing protein [Apodospora peruviana]|uniref:Amidase signature domain-containing protein n=1 Tax=Apodospora peruviana TaxID=516989 RepID=A0AAE0M538_9PEZI|nr:amidase signature domain-containing protein [Apodospora peruviana]
MISTPLKHKPNFPISTLYPLNMFPRKLVVIQPLPVAKGTPEFQASVDAILDEFAAKVPDELILPSSVTSNPPKNVTNIPRECGLLSSEEIDITENYDAVALAEAIASKKLTAVAVATAFSKRAIIAHQLTCCLVEWFMDDAIAQAKALDEHLERTGQTVGPLHGVPISVKEHMPLANHYSALGYSDTRKLDTDDAQMIAILRKAGAVFYCKTNQPQAIMHLEGVSVYGRVLNPHNIGLSAGGSTSGEAALIAMRGSVLGIGTDIGGSIRGPSAFCGIYGFKPTSYVLPLRDFLGEAGHLAEMNILVAAGPMCASLRDMDLFVSVVLAAKPYLEDPRVIPIPWTGLTGPKSSGPLKIGIMTSDGVNIPQPPVLRALEWAKSQLSKQPDAFEVKPFAPYQTARAMANINQAYWPDGGKGVREHLAKTGEPMFPLTEWTLKNVDPNVELPPSGLLKQRVDRDNFRMGFAQHWTSQDVDILICPAFVGPACEHETAFYWNYTAFFNYVDCPGVVFPTPIKALKKGEEGYPEEFKEPLGEQDTHIREMWDKGDFEGAPVALQVVARKYHDNLLFGALDQVKDALGLP